MEDFHRGPDEKDKRMILSVLLSRSRLGKADLGLKPVSQKSQACVAGDLTLPQGMQLSVLR